MKRTLLDATPEELKDWVVGRGFPVYHARQVLRWVFEHRAERFETMSDLPKVLREQLDSEWAIFETQVIYHHVSPDGTDKLLLGCADGRRVECVLMAEADRRTVCISTQLGCGMGCVFCASGLKGVERNLTRGEIVEQVLRLRNLLPPDERLTNLVVMGMGESLANLDNLLAALDRICSPEGLGLGQRRVTISTVGLPEKMLKLAAQDRQYHLAVSLHAPTEALRNELVPINERVGLDAVIAAADAYFQRSGRQVTFEYVLLRGINDRVEEAVALADLLEARKAHVNLIPYNPVAGLPFERPAPAAVHRFVGVLRSRGISTSVRKTKGREIDAACGQLRRRLEDQPRVMLPRSRSPADPIAPALSILSRIRGRSTCHSAHAGDEFLRGCWGRRRPIGRRDVVVSSEALEQQLEARDPDVRLMLQVRDDVQGAFETLVERYQHRLVGVLVHLVGRVEEAEDLTQEVFLRIYRARKGYRPRAKFSTWLFTIANNLALNHLRGKGRTPAGVAALGGDGTASGEFRPVEERVQAREGTPSAQLRSVELSEVIREALDILGEDQKMAVLLNKFEDMSYAEIAEVMGRSEAAVKSLLARARNHLRERLEPYLKTGQRGS